ncbi:peptidoglycan-binding protein [Bacillus sp. SCS-151]|uniref:C40 family peptidase n=1 Tax=Nanhaiella sioensis TaxID=3115293 RepID=UPI00397934C0
MKLSTGTKYNFVLSSVAATVVLSTSLPINTSVNSNILSVRELKKEQLRYGHTGQAVKTLQLKLKNLAMYHSHIDGVYGKKTKEAVQLFQSKTQLATDGITDQKTLTTLAKFDTLHKQKVLSYGSTGEEVVKLQHQLQNLGYYEGHVDGIFGPLTLAAVKTYQQRNKLTIDGIAGRQTLQHLETNKNKVGKTIYIKPAKQTTVNSVDTSLITIAQKYIGSPYVWGGTSPSGFDCSGFLTFVFDQKSIKIPRTVSDIWNFTVDVQNPSIGDIVFFETYKPGPSHAGIYIGNNQFIHTDSSVGVTVSHLSNSYWNSRYLGAKRVVQY